MKTRTSIIIGIFLIVTFVIFPAYASFSDSILIYIEKNFMKMYYNGKNIESVTFDPDSTSVVFETRDNAELEIKTPIVYETGPNIFILKDGEEIAPETTTDDCFYYIHIQTKTPEKIEIAYTYWPEYPQTLELCETFDISPLKQTKLGIPVDEIQCKDNFVLLQKHNGSPACVKPDSKVKLMERGWVKDFGTKQSTHSSDYNLTVEDFLNMECNELDHIFPEFPSKEIADAWNARLHECLNEKDIGGK